MFLIKANRSNKIGDLKDQSLALFPAKAGIGNTLTVDAFTYLLRPVLNVAFYHEALYQLLNIRVVTAGMQYLLADPGLLVVLLSGVSVVCIYNYRRVGKRGLGVHSAKILQILVVIIGKALSVLINVSAKNGMSAIVTRGINVPSAIYE